MHSLAERGTGAPTPGTQACRAAYRNMGICVPLFCAEEGYTDARVTVSSSARLPLGGVVALRQPCSASTPMYITALCRTVTPLQTPHESHPARI
jgi:hypothetical protein